MSEGKRRALENFKKMKEDPTSCVTLSTVHKSKGLQFQRVFVLRDDLLNRQGKTPDEDDAEKNCKYVAYTRAKHELIFDHEWTDEKMED